MKPQLQKSLFGNGTLRIVTDYRKLNDITKTFYWLLPNIDDIFASIGNSKSSGNSKKYLSTLDFMKGYHQINMCKEDREKTPFVTEQGLFQYNCLSFGLTNAPNIFTQYMARLNYSMELQNLQ